jgi:hypothetical protein
MVLAANALTTLADVKVELDITDATHDAYLETLINSVSTQIETFLQRQLESVTAFEEMVPGYGLYKLRVSRTPVLTVTAVELFSTAVPSVFYTFDLTDLQIENPNGGVLYYPGGWPWTVPLTRGTIKADPIPGQEWPAIKVTYDGGYALPAAVTPTLPADIQRACTIAVSTEYRKKGQDRTIRSESLMSYSVTYEKTGIGEATLHKLYPASPFSSQVTQMLVPHRHIPGA